MNRQGACQLSSRLGLELRLLRSDKLASGRRAPASWLTSQRHLSCQPFTVLDLAPRASLSPRTTGKKRLACSSHHRPSLLILRRTSNPASSTKRDALILAQLLPAAVGLSVSSGTFAERRLPSQRPATATAATRLSTAAARAAVALSVIAAPADTRRRTGRLVARLSAQRRRPRRRPAAAAAGPLDRERQLPLQRRHPAGLKSVVLRRRPEREPTPAESAEHDGRRQWHPSARQLAAAAGADAPAGPAVCDTVASVTLLGR